MAIATLSDLYDNPKVFTGVVKIRKGMAAKLILDTKTTGGLHKWFNYLARDILSRVNPADPSAIRTRRICNKIIDITDREGQIATWGSYAQVVNTLSPVTIVISVFHLFRRVTLDSICSTLDSKSNDSILTPIVMLIPDLRLISNIVATFSLLSSMLFMLGYAIISEEEQKKTLRRADP